MKYLLRGLGAIPAGVGYALASLAYVLVYYLIRYRRTTVRENLACAFPQKTAAERRQIEKRFYRHFCDLAVEILRSTRMSAGEFAQRVHFVNEDRLARATDHYQRQAVLLLIHQGNWEWMLHGAAQRLPVPVDPVYKTLHNPTWNAFMLEARSRFGATPIPLGKVGREAIRGRRRKRLIALLADQSGPKYGGYWTDFLNRPASFHRGADKLSQSLGLPVLFAECRKTGRGHYEIIFHDVSLPPHPADGEWILERYVRMAEEAIARQPETYLWTNRRWKKQPPEDRRPYRHAAQEGH